MLDLKLFKPLLQILIFFVLGLAVSQCSADNGEVAYALPIKGISVDGKLDDWPENMRRFEIKRDYFGGDLPDASDFLSSFRVGYDLESKSIFIALEVVDDSHVVDSSGQTVWSAQDSVNLYIDPTHSPRGSGSWLFTAIGDHRKLVGREFGWDPEVAKASWDDVEVVVSREANTTIYEWRIGLGTRLHAGRSMGLDFLITDQDKEDSPDDARMLMWGPYGGKSRGSSRCGDLVLLEPNTKTVTLRGKTGWKTVPSETNGKPYPHRVRVTSISNPQLWIHVEADDNGDFEIDVPVGEYEISCPFKSVEDNEVITKLDSSVTVRATVSVDGENKAPPLELEGLLQPDLIETRGVLFDFNDGSKAKVDKFMEEYMKYFLTPGASLALVKNNQLVYHKTYGFKNFYTQEPVTDDTLFEACSITKIVFAFAVNRMAERGEIDLDKPLHEYLPWEDIAHDDRYKKITARYVLTHRTGFPNWAYNNADGKIDIKFYPGTKFGYSGEGFEYLKRVVAKITRKTTEEFIMEEVQKPMGIEKNVFFSECDKLQKVVAHGHYTTQATAAYLPDSIGVAHSMHTESKVFSNFMVNLMNKNGLSNEGYVKMLEPAVAVELRADYQGPRWPRYYGLGFNLMDTPYGWSFGHGGSNGDFKCQFEAYPEHQIGFVIFTNGDSGYQLHEALREFLIIGKPEAVDDATTPNE